MIHRLPSFRARPPYRWAPTIARAGRCVRGPPRSGGFCLPQECLERGYKIAVAGSYDLFSVSLGNPHPLLQEPEGGRGGFLRLELQVSKRVVGLLIRMVAVLWLLANDLTLDNFLGNLLDRLRSQYIGLSPLVGRLKPAHLLRERLAKSKRLSTLCQHDVRHFRPHRVRLAVFFGLHVSI